MEVWSVTWHPEPDLKKYIPENYHLEQFWNQVEDKFIDLITGSVVSLEDEPDFVCRHILPIHWERRKHPKLGAQFVNILTGETDEENPCARMVTKHKEAIRQLEHYLNLVKFEREMCKQIGYKATFSTDILGVSTNLLENASHSDIWTIHRSDALNWLDTCSGIVKVAATMILLRELDINADELNNVKKYKRIQAQIDEFGSVVRLDGHADSDSVSMVKVYKIQYKGAPAVVKEILQVPDATAETVDVMKKLVHSNVVGYYDVILLQNRQFNIMTYCDSGTLCQAYRCKDELCADQVLEWCNQILSGLWYLHDEVKINHGNLKPSNILLTRQKSICRLSDITMEAEFAPVGKIDTFDFGMLLFELFTRSKSSHAFQPNETPILTARLPHTIRLLISLCWQTEAKCRPDDSRLHWLIAALQNNADIKADIDHWFKKRIGEKPLSFKPTETPVLQDIFNDIAELISEPEALVGMDVVNQISNVLIADFPDHVKLVAPN